MPIQLPNLDDRRFADLTEEGRQMITALAPSWTDHHLSDPGITMMELFAAVAEQLIYRTNRVTVAHKEVFLKLVEPSARESERAPDIDDELARAVARMRIETRAVTVNDYERLAREAGAAGARCLPRCKPEYEGGKLVKIGENQVGHLTLVVIDEALRAGVLRETLRGKLRPVLTTELPAGDAGSTLHIVPAQALKVNVRVTLACFAEYRADATKMVGEPVADALKRYVDCRIGGPAGNGWPLGQALYKSALYALIARLPGVDHIDLLTLSVEGPAGRANNNGVLPECYEYIEIATTCIFKHQEGGA
jgi:hypothetical protein